ncbi:glyoxalase [Dictyobacter vulcani]|uniref:Glyoxalase n=1 Tax=Dictyobacter vulcani TaxID=2607529 RepID=A0A5J4KUU1_9CHLR|nr:VOC family protein [Dictyobacter vulcani]GER91353.1 glyoxalase [Dictyobacter vulcani]
MALNLYMLGLVSPNMEKSLEFYRRLGLAIPEGSDGQKHVEVKMKGEITFFLNAPEPATVGESSRVILEFYLQDRAEVDAKYQMMVEYGYESYRAPFIASPIGMYFAMINDPDGNTILLSADAR